MREREIRELLEAEDFKPFVLHVSDRAKYEIRSRSDAFATRNVIYVGIDPDEDGVPQRTIRVDPLHITRVTPLKANGSKRRR
jgi:hypothetical protein